MPRILDLFCGAGGAGKGYVDAGFEVVGVDIEPQPRYPFEFHRADAVELLEDLLDNWPTGSPLPPLEQFDAIHASPPCQAYSALRTMPGVGEHPELVEPTRELLHATGLPYVIENVPGAPLRQPLVLCGSEFGLTVRTRPDGRLRWLRRHRLFESNVWLVGAGGCNCFRRPIAGVYGHGGGGHSRRGWQVYADEAREVLGTPWMNRDEASQAIPPAYTSFIGEQLLAHLERRVAA